MQFKVIPNSSRPPVAGRNIGYLWTDNWNDWWEFQTLYVLTYFDASGQIHEVGGLKIGQFKWKETQARPDIPREFASLDRRFFSLGQDVAYYSAIAAMGKATASGLLSAMKDVVADQDLLGRAINEPVMGRSLMRSVSLRTIEGQFRRVLGGGAPLTEFSFTYEAPKPENDQSPRLKVDFSVVPESTPPTNIHVLIGRNGVGKSYLLNGMTRALASLQEDDDANGIFQSKEDIFGHTDRSPFANVVSVTFSAFDEFVVIPESRNALKGVRYSNVGLRQRMKTKNDEWVVITRDPSELAKEFSASAKLCAIGARGTRWKHALATLETDPIFAEAQVSALANTDEVQFPRQAAQLFRKLSSGHKIVLLTITKLVEKVEEKTLVIMDEPEAHLHPPLLSAFVRALSDLLIDRNGVAIVATHSPVVLQEVPASCVWKIVRHGMAARADRPEIETFGENVGVLTREVFSLEVTRSGFHKMLTDAIEDSETAEAVLEKFSQQIGSDGRALLSNLLAARSVRRGR
jgi:predicted ATPase